MAPGTASTLKLATILGLVPSAMVAFAVFWPGPGLISSRGYYLGQDFVNFWTGGKLALEGRVADIYDQQAYQTIIEHWFAPAYGVLTFSYPPHSLPLLAFIGLLPYKLALTAWTVGGLCAFVLIAFRGCPRDHAAELAAFVLFSPITLLVITVGQASLLLAGLFVGGLHLLSKRPVAAGILFGLLTVKPQLGALLAPALLLLGHVRTFIAAAATALVLVLLATALFGFDPWVRYLTVTLPFQTRVITEMVGLYPTMMVTPYAEFWWLGLSSSTALALHALVAVGIGVVAWFVVPGCVDRALRIVLLALASVLVIPYCLNYDLAIPMAAIIVWASCRMQPLPGLTRAALGLFWGLPYVSMALVLWHLPVLPIIAVGLFALLALEAWKSPKVRIEPALR